ncbi:hypothetical protein AJ79_07516 [Helicocarpus griseus UAMH5409]|uniref:Methyltransferase domain-containing protein n=1 Tax=Helicocarpus griseus UAMH5409 TaxID=1447875 RepID=A0A2B7X1Z3_9EURO|nr:hypothetical protein AJ79_07516 [Helicocarpus griseus UAMH5409]
MPPKSPLPLPADWPDADAYISSLLSFATTSDIFRNLCGGVHILDFLTRVPDLYSTVLPQDWRDFFAHHDIQDILDLFMREDIQPLRDIHIKSAKSQGDNGGGAQDWRGGPTPPVSLLQYIHDIRRHSLQREFRPASVTTPDTSANGNIDDKNTRQSHNPNAHVPIPRHIAVGMKPKKAHEVAHFARYVDTLTDTIEQGRGGEGANSEKISHIVDFGSGQNYLGRTLASPLYNRRIIAIERRQNNISGAKGKDVHAKLKKKVVVVRNKEVYKEALNGNLNENGDGNSVVGTPLGSAVSVQGSGAIDRVSAEGEGEGERETVATVLHVEAGKEGADHDVDGCDDCFKGKPMGEKEEQNGPKGSMDYIEHDIKDGYLEPIIKHVVEPASPTPETNPSRVMVISLHSCGNLVHHGIRSLVLNPSVTAIAMIGCCYNLMTERLGPVTYKLPVLRALHPRLEATSMAYDPHGFPMSQRLETYPHEGGTGIKLNITARMMAVQAPYNWGPEDSEAFFTRHFFRALLQRVLVDYGVVPVPGSVADAEMEANANGNGNGNGVKREVCGTPLIVGSMRKASFVSFAAYARGAIAKLSRDDHYGDAIKKKVAPLSDAHFEEYEQKYAGSKKNLSVVWSLMAFSAGVVESLIVADRWLFLREQEDVKEAWVETVFDYALSPRNLVVVGVKK